MKKLFLLLLLGITMSAFAQGTWILNESSITKNINSVCFSPDKRGWGVGDNGLFILSNNSGRKWSEQSLGITTNLKSILFYDNYIALITGEAGTLFRTSNRGVTWTNVVSGTSNNLYKAFYVNETTALVSGGAGTILKSTNGGINWTVKNSGVLVDLKRISFFDANNGISVGNGGTIIRTVNGGESWTLCNANVISNLNDVAIKSGSIVYAAGDGGVIIKSTDTGTTWQNLTSGITSNINSIYFLNELVGWCVCSEGKIIKTTDGGTTWHNEITNTSNNIIGITSNYLNSYWAVGASGTIMQKLPYNSYSPSSITFSDNQPIEISFLINDVIGITSASILLQFNHKRIEIIEVSQGDFLLNNPANEDVSFSFTPELSNMADSIQINQAIQGTSSVDGSGTLFKLKLAPKIIGTSSITIKSFVFSDKDADNFKIITNEMPITINLSAVQPRVFLQGPFNNTSGIMDANLLPSQLPLSQPFNIAPFNYNGTEKVEANFFNLNPSIVDWVLLELRTGLEASTTVCSRAALLKNNGTPVDLDGLSSVTFPNQLTGSYYLVVKHRNHLGIMSSVLHSINELSIYDFTTSQTSAYGSNPMVQLSTGIYGMPTGDANADGNITSSDFNIFNPAFRNLSTGYLNSDFNLDGFINSTDFNCFNPNYRNILSTQVPN